MFCYEYSTRDATFVYAHISSSDGRLLNILKPFLAQLGLQKSLWFLSPQNSASAFLISFFVFFAIIQFASDAI